MPIKLDRWLVFVAARAPDPIDSNMIRQILEQSDLGGDIEWFSGGTSTVVLTIAAFAETEQRANRRVLARVKDALGGRWMVQADAGASAGWAPVAPPDS